MATFIQKIDRRTLVLGASATAGLCAAGGLGARPAQAAVKYATGPATIAVAASLRFVFQEAASVWRSNAENVGRDDIRLVFGATRTLVHQIEHGAPFDAMFTADVKSAERLSHKNLAVKAPQVFARGQLALVSIKSSGLEVDANLVGLKAAVRSGQLKRLAIANPKLAPYGLAATQALQKAGVWDEVADRLALGENVGQAAQFAMSGAAQAGVIALSLARAAKPPNLLNVAVIDQDWHAPIDHAMIRLRTASTMTDRFCAFVAGAEMADILSRHGFVAPGV